MKKQLGVGSLRTVPDAHCQASKTANASNEEERCMTPPNAEPVLDEALDLESRFFRAKLTALEVARHLKVHPSMVCRMAKRGELPGFKVGSAWRFDRAQVEAWMRSRMHEAEG